MKRVNNRADDRRVSLYCTMVGPFPLSKLPLTMRGSGTNLIHGFLGPPNAYGISIASAVFAGLASVSFRP